MSRILKPKALWDQGISLHLAWEEYAPAEMREKLLTLNEPVQPTEISSEKGFLENIGGVLREIQIAQGRTQLRSELIEKIKDEVICDLYNEDLYAYGYPVAPSRARTPRKIDPNFWYDPKVDWDGCAASTLQNSFYRIRVIDPDNYPQLDFSPKTPGPKSKRNIIMEALEFHHKNDEDFWYITDVKRIHRLKKTIKHNFPEIDILQRGFGEKNFQKYILEFKKDKNI